MRNRSPFMMLLLALLLTVSHVAMAAHDGMHANGPADTQQCLLCVNANQPLVEPMTAIVLDFPSVEKFRINPFNAVCLQSNTTTHDHNPRASPSIF